MYDKIDEILLDEIFKVVFNYSQPPFIVTPLGTKKKWCDYKNTTVYDVTKERVSLLVTWANVNVLIRRDVTISGVTIERVDCK